MIEITQQHIAMEHETAPTDEDIESLWTGKSTSSTTESYIKYRRLLSSTAAMFSLVVLLSTYTLLIAYSSDGSGNYTFFFTTVTLAGELLKLLISVVLCVLTRCIYPKDTRTPLLLTAKKSLHFAVPAVLYCLNNNLLFLILVVVDPTTFQLLSHISIVFVALFTLLLMHRTLDAVQWISMITLFVGTALTQLNCSTVLTRSKSLGLLLIALYAAMDAFGSVYTERRLKMDARDSIHVQNIHLFTYSSAANALLFAIYDFRHAQHSGFFYGYSWITVTIVIAFGLFGIISNLIMKQQSTIARSFCVSIAVLLTALLAYLFLDFEPTLLLAASFVIVLCSVLLYRHRDLHGLLFLCGTGDYEPPSARVTELSNFVAQQEETEEDAVITSILGQDPEAIELQAQAKQD